MSRILAYVDWDDRPVDLALLRAMADAARLEAPGGLQSWIRGGVGLAMMPSPLATRSASGSRSLERGGLVLTADARLDNRSDLISALGAGEFGEDPDPTDAMLIGAAFRRWGERCPEHLIGDYAFAIWDPDERRLFAARDPMAMRPLYYRDDSERLIVASEVKQILAAPRVSARVNERALAAHVAGPYGCPAWSFLEGVYQLAPGHILLADRTGVSTRRIAVIDPGSRVRYRRESAYADHFRQVFEQAVASRLDSPSPVGLMLSGGVDSSSIATMAGLLVADGRSGAPGFHTYSWAFDGLPDSDERATSRAILEHFGLEGTDIPADDLWPLRGHPQHGPDVEDPFVWAYQALMDTTLDQARAEGMGTVLNGDRGDEVVGDWVYDHPGMFRAGRWTGLLHDLRILRKPLLGAFGDEVLRPLLHLGSQREPMKIDPAPWIRPDAVQRWGLHDLVRSPSFSPDFDDDARRRRFQRIFSFTGTRIAGLAERRRSARGLGFADPWADLRIIRYILSVPQWVVNRPSDGKRIVREAMRGIMPEKARLRMGKTIPEGLFKRGLAEREVETVRNLFRDPMLAQLGLVEPTALQAAYDSFLAGEARPHDFWWPLTAEIWLRAHWS